MTFEVGDWVRVVGDYIQAFEYDIKLNKNISQVIFDKNYNPGDLELIRKIGPYWLSRTDDGRYYKIGNRALTNYGNFNVLDKMDSLNEGIIDSINTLKRGVKIGAITASAILSLLNASAQDTNKTKEIIKIVNQFGNDKLLKDLQDKTNIKWDANTANRLFKYEKNNNLQLKIPKLDLGKYGELGIAKISHEGKNKTGGFRYIIDITERRFIDTEIFNKIKEYNKNLKNILIYFTINGKKLENKYIKL